MDTSQIAALFDQEGPFVSLYLDAESSVEDAAPRLELRWKNARRDLEEAGADEATLAAIDDVIDGGQAHRGGDGLAVIAAGDRVVFRRHLPVKPSADVARVAPLPVLGPLLSLDQVLVPHVVVLADRTGADLFSMDEQAVLGIEQVQGAEKDEVQKASPGGWSQRRYQQRAENTWESNMEEVAQATAEMAEAISARVVIVAGDVRAVQFLQEHLPKSVAAITEVLDHGQRNADGSIGDVEDDVRRVVKTAAANETVTLLQKFKEEAGQGDRAADGHARTIEALQRAQVETLLVHDAGDDDRSAWYGPQAVHIATEPQSLRDMGVDDPQEGRLVDLLIRAAAGTGAAVRLIPSARSGPSEGIGAILRHTGTAPETPGTSAS